MFKAQHCGRPQSQSVVWTERQRHSIRLCRNDTAITKETKKKKGQERLKNAWCVQEQCHCILNKACCVEVIHCFTILSRFFVKHRPKCESLRHVIEGEPSAQDKVTVLSKVVLSCFHNRNAFKNIFNFSQERLLLCSVGLC